jgi:hypothetical protein
MRKNVKTYSEFIVEEISWEDSTPALNEGIFDALKSLFGKISTMFKDPVMLTKQVDQAAVKAGVKDDKVIPKSVKNGSTLIVKLQDPADETRKSILSLTKLADLPDSSGLFQVSGSDSPEFLKSIGVADVAKLNEVGVLAIVPPEGFVKDKPMTSRMYKNLDKSGKPIVTKTLVKTTLLADAVAKEKPE